MTWHVYIWQSGQHKHMQCKCYMDTWHIDYFIIWQAGSKLTHAKQTIRWYIYFTSLCDKQTLHDIYTLSHYVTSMLYMNIHSMLLCNKQTLLEYRECHYMTSMLYMNIYCVIMWQADCTWLYDTYTLSHHVTSRHDISACHVHSMWTYDTQTLWSCDKQTA